MIQFGGDMGIIEPPFTITEKANELMGQIIDMSSHLENNTDFKRDIQLHRENRLKSIQSSCAIEGNTLTFAEVKDVVSGRVVYRSQQEISEIKNAYIAYEKILSYDPYSIQDFLVAHGLMTQGFIQESGRFRSGDVAISNGETIFHIGDRPQFVHGLIADLFAWAKQSDIHPLLNSAIVHFEIETVHPFADGNGRMGRLWHTLILAKWNELFQWIPIESNINKRRPEYYEALQNARKDNDSAVFIEYCLSVVLEAVSTQITLQSE